MSRCSALFAELRQAFGEMSLEDLTEQELTDLLLVALRVRRQVAEREACGRGPALKVVE